MFKKIKLVIAMAIIAGEAIAQQPAMPADSLLTLSLEECITIALNESPTIKVADMEITRVDYSKKEVLGQLFPNIAFNGTYQRTLAKQVTYFDMDMSKFGGGGSTGEVTIVILRLAHCDPGVVEEGVELFAGAKCLLLG